MKKLIINISLFLTVILFLDACSEEKQEKSILNQVNLSQEFPKKEFIFQELGKVKYIKIPTEDDLLLDKNNSLFHVSDKYICFANKRLGDIFVFSGKGNPLYSFNRKGESGEEYRSIHCVFFDEKREEFYIANRHPNSEILIYTISGDYKKTIPLSIKDYNIYDFDTDHILLYEEVGMRAEEFNTTPYSLISKEDGSAVKTVDILLPERYTTKKLLNVKVGMQNQVQPVFLYLFSNYYRGDELLVADISSDTIFLASPHKELSPLLTRTPSVHDEEPRMVWAPILTTDKFIVGAKAVLDFELARTEGKYLYSEFIHFFDEDITYEHKFINTDYSKYTKWVFAEAKTNKNVGVCMLNAFDLVEAYEDNLLKGELKKIASGLSMEDNGVLMIVDFNQ